MQHYFRLISLLAVLALAGCANTPETRGTRQQADAASGSRTRGAVHENGNTSHRVGEAGEQRLFRAGIFGY